MGGVTAEVTAEPKICSRMSSKPWPGSESTQLAEDVAETAVHHHHDHHRLDQRVDLVLPPATLSPRWCLHDSLFLASSGTVGKLYFNGSKMQGTGIYIYSGVGRSYRGPRIKSQQTQRL
jgi:hypothetical protein